MPGKSTTRYTAAVAAFSVATAAAVATAQEDRILDFPDDYLASFTRYYSGDRLFEAEQTITLYANDTAREGALADGRLPNGSVLVAEIFAARKDADGKVIESALERRLPGALKAIAVMERREGWDAQYPDDLKVGDWEFELFSAGGENLGKDMTACRECHHPLEDSDFLFSLEHLTAVAR